MCTTAVLQCDLNNANVPDNKQHTIGITIKSRYGLGMCGNRNIQKFDIRSDVFLTETACNLPCK